MTRMDMVNFGNVQADMQQFYSAAEQKLREITAYVIAHCKDEKFNPENWIRLYGTICVAVGEIHDMLETRQAQPEYRSAFIRGQTAVLQNLIGQYETLKKQLEGGK